MTNLVPIESALNANHDGDGAVEGRTKPQFLTCYSQCDMGCRIKLLHFYAFVDEQ